MTGVVADFVGFARFGPTATPVARSRSSRAKRVLATAMTVFVASSVGVSLLLQNRWLHAVDPEYAARRDRLLAKQAATAKPIVLCLGSSRMVEGVRPDALPTDTLLTLVNGGMVGSGSMLEWLTYRRLKRDGLKPARVLIEYWPPLLRGDDHAEYGRIALPRLAPADWPVVRACYPDPPSVGRYVAEGQFWPVHRYRRGLLAMIQPRWVPEARADRRFASGMDEWGWWPGCRDEDADAERAKHGDPAKSAFRPYLDGFSVGGPADVALRSLLAECRADGVPATLVYLPESTGFQSLYSPEAEANWQSHLASLRRDFDVAFLDFRTADFDADLPDGVHLTQGGAKRLTRLLSRKLAD
jgi:hypothetical protein